MACVRTFCYRLSGRGPPQGNVPLRSGEAVSPEDAAREALPQVQHLQLQYERLLPCLLDALASARCSQARVERARASLADIVALLEGIAASGGAERGVQEVSVNCNVLVGGGWETKRVVLSAEGFSLVDRNSQEGTELTPWSDVSSPGPEASEPGGSETPTAPWRRVTRWMRAPSESTVSNLYQAELQLPNRRITLQFGAAGPPELMKRLWQASQGRGPPGPGAKVQPLLKLLEKCTEGAQGLDLMTIYQEPLRLHMNLLKVRELLRRDAENPIQKMHETTRAENVVSWSWSSEVLSPGAVKFFEFKQILPAGLGPSETRVSAVYYLEPDDPNQVVLHKVTKAWDIPFKDDFLVYHKHTFAKADEEVSLQIELGLHWIGSPLKLAAIKPIIRQNTKAETLGSGQALLQCFNG